jgi:Sec7 domain
MFILIQTYRRRLCTKLFLRAESQALDRILVEFSRRYWEHNPNCILGSSSKSIVVAPQVGAYKHVI